MKKFLLFAVCTLFLFSSCTLLSKFKKEKPEEKIPLSKQIADNGYDATVYFKVSSYELDFKMEDILKRVARLQAISKTDVFLKGHSDITGRKELNFTLSEQRVESVKRYLMVLGVKEEWIHTSFYGDEIPAMIGETPEAFSKNRRVEIALKMVRDENDALKLSPEEEKKQDEEIKKIDSGIKQLEEEQVQELEAEEKKMKEEKIPPAAPSETPVDIPADIPADAAEVSEENTVPAVEESGVDIPADIPADTAADLSEGNMELAEKDAIQTEGNDAWKEVEEIQLAEEME